MTVDQLKKLTARISKRVTHMHKCKGDAGGASKLQDFRDQSCLACEEEGALGSPAPSQSGQLPPALQCVLLSLTYHHRCPQPPAHLLFFSLRWTWATAHPPPSTVVACDLPAVKSTLVNPATSSTALDFEELTEDAEISALKEILKERDPTIRSLKEQIVRLTKEKETSKQKLVAAKVQNKDLTEQITAKIKKFSILKQTTIYKQYSRQKLKIKQQKQELEELQGDHQTAEEQKTLKRRAQVHASKVEAKLRRLETDLETSREIVRQFEQEDAALPIAPPQTRDPSGKFTAPVVKCVMELVGEHKVPVRRCSDIIKTVSRSLFNVHFNDSALPSKTSNLRFADQAHGIARLHISEALSQKLFDFHVDGT